MKTVVVVPVYNEKGTVVSVLEALHVLGVVDEIVVVNDGSSDGSGDLIAEWARGRDKVKILSHPKNRGYSEALLTGFRYVLAEVEQGRLSASDAVATVDADGQHDPAELPGFLKVLQEEDLDVVWARRDFSLYPWFKRLGNRLMSAIGSLFAGFSFKDVESGYCVFRLAALKDALRYQSRDSRYSLSLTLAVALARLKYRISNNPVAHVKLFRSRTRVTDGIWDTLASANVWARVMASSLRSSPTLAIQMVLSVLVFAGLLAVLLLLAIKRVYLGYDSINNYAHVWYISKNLYHGSLPMHFENLSDGKALTYPYSFVPWTLAALLYPVLRDYAVTWTLVLGFVLLFLVVYWTRFNSNIWHLTLFALVPLSLQALLNFQMPFVWAMLFGYLYVWALEKRAFKWAYLWLVLAVCDHLIVMGPILIGYTAWVYWTQPSLRNRLGWIWGLALIPVVPLAWYTLTSPTISENTSSFIAVTAIETITARAVFFFTPFIITRLASLRGQWGRVLVGLAGAALLLGFAAWVNISYSSYSGPVTQANNYYEAYLESQAFSQAIAHGDVYRVVESKGQEQGEYYFIRHGAILSNEFFSESYHRRNWTDAGYEKYILEKGVDFVVIRADYLRRYHTNERQVLEQLGAPLIYQDPQGRFWVYDVRNVRSTLEGHSVGEIIIGEP